MSTELQTHNASNASGRTNTQREAGNSSQTDNNAQVNNNPQQNDSDQRIPVWMYCKLQLNGLNTRTQSFQIEGFVTTFWRWPKYDSIANDSDQKLKKTARTFYSYCFKRKEDIQNNAQVEEQPENKEDIPVAQIKTEKMKEMIKDIIKGIKEKEKDESKNDSPLKRRDNIRSWLFKENHQQRIIQIRDLTEGNDIYFYRNLPIDPRILFDPRSTIEFKHSDLPQLYYNMHTGAAQIQVKFQATLSEKLELYNWPMDQQYLNAKILFKGTKFKMITPNDDGKLDVDEKASEIHKDMLSLIQELPAGVKYKDRWSKLIQVTLNESSSYDIDMLSPTIYFDDAEEDSKCISWIRLRAERNPMYYLWTTIVPVMLVVLTSIASFSITNKDNALTYAITVLLTYAAIQNAVNDELPRVAEMFFADYYILFGYLVQAFVILVIVFGGLGDDELYDDVDTVINNKTWKVVVGVSCGVWGFMNLLYFLLWFQCRWCIACNRCYCSYCRKCYRSNCLCCFKYWCEMTSDWQEKGKHEIEDWKEWSLYEKELTLKGDKMEIGNNYCK